MRPILIWIALLIVLALSCLGGSMLIGRTIRSSLDAEMRLHSTIVLARATNAFALSQEPPRWPSSWEELKTVEIDYDWFNWPDDEAYIRKFATIDFSALLEEIVQQSEQEVGAIRPLGACDSSWQNHVWFALQPAREALSGEISP